MRAVVSRVSKASVSVGDELVGQIGKGLLIYIGISETDSEKEIKRFCHKVVNLRIFPDENDKMNLSLSDIGGGILIISNFTLYGNAKKGFRPSYIKSAPPKISEPLYNKTVEYLRENYPLRIESGIFGAMMDVESVNDGPVNIIIDIDANVNKQ